MVRLVTSQYSIYTSQGRWFCDVQMGLLGNKVCVIVIIIVQSRFCNRGPYKCEIEFFIGRQRVAQTDYVLLIQFGICRFCATCATLLTSMGEIWHGKAYCANFHIVAVAVSDLGLKNCYNWGF